MMYQKLILVIVLIIATVGASADKKKKKWPTDPDYLARRDATIQAMDSVLKYANTDPEPLMLFADEKCKEFDNDPVLMSGIAEGFATRAGQIELSIQRFRELKRMHPDFLDGYYNYALTIDAKAVEVKPEGNLSRDESLCKLAKAQMDSAKVAFPNNQQPYVMWLRRCTRYIFNDAIKKEFEAEVEAYRKAFPQENVYYIAANILSDNDIKMEMTNFNDNKLRSDAEYERSQLALSYFGRIDINALNSDQLNNLVYYYYESTKSLYLDSEQKAVFYEKGLDGARLGLSKYPENINFNRFALYHAAELAKYDKEKYKEYAIQAHANGEKLMGGTDNLLREDYFYTAIALQYMEDYSGAMNMYKMALEKRIPYIERYHHCDSLTAFQNMADCYRGMGDYWQAIEQLKKMYNVRKLKGQQLTGRDLTALVRLYVPIGNDTTKTQKERFQAFVAIDELYGTCQDSIDAGNESFMLADGYTGYYTAQRMRIRNVMNGLSDYVDRSDYLLLDMAEEVVRRIEPLPQKSDDELSYLKNAIETLWYNHYEKENYSEAIKYLTMGQKYNPEKKEVYQKNITVLQKNVKKKR